MCIGSDQGIAIALEPFNRYIHNRRPALDQSGTCCKRIQLTKLWYIML